MLPYGNVIQLYSWWRICRRGCSGYSTYWMCLRKKKHIVLLQPLFRDVIMNGLMDECNVSFDVQIVHLCRVQYGFVRAFQRPITAVSSVRDVCGKSTHPSFLLCFPSNRVFPPWIQSTTYHNIHILEYHNIVIFAVYLPIICMWQANVRDIAKALNTIIRPYEWMND